MRMLADPSRWDGFAFRDGDIVISTSSKSGTTWTQMICALLIFQTPRLPAPLAELSPWLDWAGDARARLEQQEHRRFIKTHTPLDRVPIDPRVTYIVVGRHPLDIAVSLYHQGNNIDPVRLRELTGDVPIPDAPPRRADPHEWLLRWIFQRRDPDSLSGVLRHLSAAWPVRDVLLIRYDDLLADLGGQMRRIAARLGIAVPPERWPALVQAAGFEAMRARAASLVPDGGILRDPRAFFHGGRSGAGAALLTPDERDAYLRRTGELAPPDLVAWLHGGR